MLTWAHPVAAVLDMGVTKKGTYRHRVLFSSQKVWTEKKMDFTIQFIKMNTRAELKSVKSCPCRIGGDQALDALGANGIHDQDNLGHWSDQDEEPEPSTTETPVTEPPVTEPPVTEPPITEPPITEPPVTEPPVTEAPVTEPPVTEPPVTQPPVTEPPVTEPPITEPPVTEPPVTEPPITEPPVTEPPATEPPVTEPPVTEPPVTEPPITEPPVTETPEPKVVKTMKSNIVVAIDTPFLFTRKVPD